MKIDKQYLEKYAWTDDYKLNRELREKLMKEDPHCHWCGIEVVSFKLPSHATMPKNFATIDHLYDRYDPKNRYKIYKNNENKVLACNGCNAKREKERTKTQPLHLIKLRTKIAKDRPKGMPRPLFWKEKGVLDF